MMSDELGKLWWEPGKTVMHGHQDRAVMPGRSICQLGYWIVLSITAGVDLPDLDQLLSLVTQTSKPWLITVLVAGSPQARWRLRSLAGRKAREAKARRGLASWVKVWLLDLPSAPLSRVWRRRQARAPSASSSGIATRP
jgi:hypothetical protein